MCARVFVGIFCQDKLAAAGQIYKDVTSRGIQTHPETSLNSSLHVDSAVVNVCPSTMRTQPLAGEGPCDMLSDATGKCCDEFAAEVPSEGKLSRLPKVSPLCDMMLGCVVMVSSERCGQTTMRASFGKTYITGIQGLPDNNITSVQPPMDVETHLAAMSASICSAQAVISVSLKSFHAGRRVIQAHSHQLVSVVGKMARRKTDINRSFHFVARQHPEADSSLTKMAHGGLYTRL